MATRFLLHRHAFTAMKAIVLSCDRYHAFARHMILRYDRLWPRHPFTFRVPYQDESSHHLQAMCATSRIEPRRTSAMIKPTLLSMIEDLDDTEWVYWCIDDKYPIEIDTRVARRCHDFARKADQDSADGLLFCRARKLLEEENLRPGSNARVTRSIEVMERRNYHQFWLHQYVRVGILRRLFKTFPDSDFRPKTMDFLTGQDEGLKVKAFGRRQKMYVTLASYASFGESTDGGKVTLNCRESMAESGITLPDGFETLPQSTIIGSDIK